MGTGEGVKILKKMVKWFVYGPFWMECSGKQKYNKVHERPNFIYNLSNDLALIALS